MNVLPSRGVVPDPRTTASRRIVREQLEAPGARDARASEAAAAPRHAFGARNAAVRHGDGGLGWQGFAPYDRVVVAAAAPRVPEALLAQSSERGQIVIPVGGPDSQVLEAWSRDSNGTWMRKQHRECRFVPLVGRDAWATRDPASEASGRGSAW